MSLQHERHSALTTTTGTDKKMARQRRNRKYDDAATIERFREIIKTAASLEEIRRACKDRREYRALQSRLRTDPKTGAFFLVRVRRKAGKKPQYDDRTARKILNMLTVRIVQEAILPPSPATNAIKGAARNLFSDLAHELSNHPLYRPKYPYNGGASINLVPGSKKFMQRIQREHPRLYAQVLAALKANWTVHRSFKRTVRMS